MITTLRCLKRLSYKSRFYWLFVDATNWYITWKYGPQTKGW